MDIKNAQPVTPNNRVSYVIDGLNTGTDDAILYTTGVDVGYGLYEVTNGALVTRAAYRNGTVRFRLNISAAPDVADTHFIGFLNYGLYSEARDSALFQWDAGTVYARAYDDSGNVLINEAFTWDAAWTGAYTTFEIKRTAKSITFSIYNDSASETKTASYSEGAFKQYCNTGLQFTNSVTTALLYIEFIDVETSSVFETTGKSSTYITGGQDPYLKVDALLNGGIRGLAVNVVSPQGEVVDPRDGTQYIVNIDEASATITYVGEALPGLTNSQSVWRIKRIDTSSGLVIKWAGGQASFVNIWDDRASYSYS
jgi:hypothetical protein